MFLRPGSLRRTVSSLLATVMVATTLPFSAVSSAIAAPTSQSSRPAYADLASSGPVGFGDIKPATSNRLNVRWRPGVPASQISAAARTLGFKVARTSMLGWVQLTPAPRMTTGALATSLRESGLAVEARAAVMYQPATGPSTTPNDPMFPGQYGLNNTGQTGGTADADIDAAEAWVRETGSRNVIVAVVDEGINISHPDLKNNIWVNKDEIPNNGEDDDDNGYVDDVKGYDFYNYDSTVFDISDGDRHGTHVAGVIGAQGNNSLGVAGVNWNVTIMPAKFLGPYGGDDFSGAEAIVYAVDNGADVINCSWGGYGASEIIDEAIEYARKANVLIVAAAGNSGANVDNEPFWPAGSDSPNVITVAATDKDDKLAHFSNYGSRTVDLAAPGVDVTSTLPFEPNGVFVDYIDTKTAYKVMYLPIQVESIEPAASRDALIQRSVKRLGAVAGTPILVVDDSAAAITGETQGPRLDTYLGALAAAGFTNVNTWVTDAKGTPTQAAMQGKVVVWFTGKNAYGWYGEYTLSKADQAAIATYLDNGGRLFMASGEMATDMEYFGGQYDEDYWFGDGATTEELPFLQKYFHVMSTDFITWSNTFYGKANTQFAGITGTIPDIFSGSEEDTAQLWPTGSDAVTPLYDIPYILGQEPMPGEGEEPGYPGAEPDTTTPEPTRESVSTQVIVGQYGKLSGTSMAAPMVSGALALLMAEFPAATADEIQARILNTVDATNALEGKTVFGGRLNVFSAMSTYPGRPTITGPSIDKTLIGGTESTVTWTPAKGGDPAATFEAEIGLPYTEWSTGFEDGTLGEFSTLETFTPWAVSTDASDTHSGAYGAVSGPVGPGIDVGGGWTEAAMSAMATTVTVPAGGGTLSFWWRGNVDGMQGGMCAIDGGADGAELWESSDWTLQTFDLGPGEHSIIFAYYNFGDVATTPVQRMGVDDMTLTAHAFTPLGTAPAGSKALGFTVPGVDTDDAWLRVRAKNGVSSAWAYSRGHMISTDAVAPGAPTGLTATAAGDGVVDIAWTNPTDTDFTSSKVLWRAGTPPTGADDASATVAYEGTATVASVGGLVDGKTVYVAAYAQDKARNVSAPATASVNVIDVTAPSAVSFLEARMLDGAVTLDWMPPSPVTYDKITVLRRTDRTPTAGDAAAAKVFEGRGSVASDWELPESTRAAYYTAYATDASGNRSAVKSIRFVPDLVGPDGYISINGDDEFTGDPTVTVVSDVTGATEMRLFPNGEFDPEAPWVPFGRTRTVELLPVDGMQTVVGEYRDAAGNNFSTESSIYVDLSAPAKPAGLLAENWNVGVKLCWDDPEDGSVVAYKVWKATSPSGPWTLLPPSEDVGMVFNEVYVGGLTYKRTYYFKIAAVDGVGNVGPQSGVVSSTVGTGVVRRAGDTRYDTAAIASAKHFKSADTVVLVSGMAPADALGAAPLAGVVEGPVLLTAKGTLDPFAVKEIKRLGASEVIIVGGTGSVSNAVASKLKASGLTVSRIAGADRYEVAADVAREVIERSMDEPPVEEPGADPSEMTLEEFMEYLKSLLEGGGIDEGGYGWDGSVIVANGMATADALAVAPLAYQSRTPILLVRGTNVPEATQQFVDEYGPLEGALVVGGTSSVTESVAVKVSPLWRRLGGKTRYDIAVSVADYAVDQGILGWERVGLVSGTAYADGLAAGPAMGAIGGVVLLTPADKLHPSTLNALEQHADEIGKVEIFGGAGSVGYRVSAQVREAIKSPLQ